MNNELQSTSDPDTRQKILIVDDNQDFIDSLVDVLTIRNIEIKSANNVKTAVEVNRQFNAQLALLDLKLPDGSGTDLMQQLNQDNECLCILITGHADIPTAVEALEKGAFHYLQKPFSPPELIQLIERGFETITLKRDKQQAEITLRRAVKMEAIGQLTGGIAHDFNNILGIIQGNLHFLVKSERLNDKDRKHLSVIEHSTQRAVDLTRRLLGFSRRDAASRKKLNINTRLADMQHIIEQAVKPSIDLSCRYGEKLWDVEIDPGELEDAMLNLVLNARDAMSRHGMVIIESSNLVVDESFRIVNPLAVPGEYVLVSVQDHGTGMTPEIQERVFEPFFTTKDKGKGTGLGLAMVFGFVERCSGFVNVISEPGRGSTFQLYIPRAGSTAVEGEYAGDQLPPVGMETILVVDDEQDLVEVSANMLSTLGYKVVKAYSGTDAINILKENDDIDLVFSDVVMPGGVTGYDIAQYVGRKYPQMKMLLTSGYRKGVDGEEYHTEYEVLNKPFDLHALAKQVRVTLDS